MTSPVHLLRVSLKLRFVPLLGTLVLASCGRQQSQTIKPEAANPRSVTISWTPSKTAVAGYNVYRVLPPGGPIKLSRSIVTDSQFTDHTVQAGSAYFYFVTTVDSKGVESAPSQKLSVSVPTDPPPTAKQ